MTVARKGRSEYLSALRKIQFQNSRDLGLCAALVRTQLIGTGLARRWRRVHVANAHIVGLGAIGRRPFGADDPAPLVFPKPLEAVGRQRCVALRAHNRAVTEIALDGPRVVPIVGELVAA
jgi:hypothetical protein